MSKRYRVNRGGDVKKFRRTSMKTKAINRTVGNTQGGIRF